MASIFESIGFSYISACGLRAIELVTSAQRRWLLFDFDDKRLARAFAHGAR